MNDPVQCLCDSCLQSSEYIEFKILIRHVACEVCRLVQTCCWDSSLWAIWTNDQSIARCSQLNKSRPIIMSILQKCNSYPAFVANPTCLSPPTRNGFGSHKLSSWSPRKISAGLHYVTLLAEINILLWHIIEIYRMVHGWNIPWDYTRTYSSKVVSKSKDRYIGNWNLCCWRQQQSGSPTPLPELSQHENYHFQHTCIVDALYIIWLRAFLRGMSLLTSDVTM